MTAEVRAWARERLAQEIHDTACTATDGIGCAWADLDFDPQAPCDLSRSTKPFADAVLAVLPELLTDERVVSAVARNHSHNVIGDFVFDGNDHGDAPDRYRAEARAALTATAETLAGAS